VFETVALSDIIYVYLALCLDSFFTNERQVEVEHEHSEKGHSVGTAPTARLAGSSE
jgi:hypothetical protein